MDTEVGQDNETVLTEQKDKLVLKKDNKLVLVLTHIIIIGLLLAVIGYLYFNNASKDDLIKTQKAEIAAQNKQAAVVKVPVTESKSQPEASEVVVSTTPVPSVINTPSETAISNIKASVSIGNTQPLEGYMATTVNVILAATEAYGPQTASQAVSRVTTFIGDSATTTWDFALGASILSSYGQGSYSQYFPNSAIVGKSSDNKVISFSFDSNGKVSTIFMAANENLLQ